MDDRQRAEGGVGLAIQQRRRDPDTVGGGADIGQQYIRAGLVDEISIHLVPVLFGGTRMFEHLSGEHIHLETVKVIGNPAATHPRFRIVK